MSVAGIATLPHVTDPEVAELVRALEQWSTEVDADQLDGQHGTYYLSEADWAAQGDIIAGGAEAWTTLSVGTAGQVLMSDGTDPGWTTTFTAEMLFNASIKATFNDAAKSLSWDGTNLALVTDAGGISLNTTAETVLTTPVANTLVVGTEAELGQWPVNAAYAYFGNADLDHSVAGNYALLQSAAGVTSLNSASGRDLRFAIDNAVRLTIFAAAHMRVAGTNRLQFRDAAIHIASLNDTFLDLVADGAIRLTTTSAVTLTVPGSGTLQIAGDLWLIDSGGNPRIVLGDSSSAGTWGGMRWVSASDSIGIGTQAGGVDTLLISEAGNVLLANTGQFQFGDAGQHIYESAPTVLSYVSAGRHEFTGGPVYVGAGSPGHTITGSGDLYVADRLEVDGPAYFDDQTYFYGLMDCRNEDIMRFYGSTFGGLYRLGGDGLHFYVYGGAGSAQNRNIIICDYAARLDDYDHSAISANPTFFVHSLTRAASETDEWWSITHDQTDALYSVGSGSHKFNADINLASAKVYKANGTQVVGSRKTHVADADGTLASVTARLNDALARLESHGLFASA